MMLLLWTAMVSAWGAAFVTKIESCSFDFSFYLFFPHMMSSLSKNKHLSYSRAHSMPQKKLSY